MSSSALSKLSLSSGALSIAASLTAAGCYGSAPPRPETVALPQVAAGSELRVTSESTTRLENVQKQSETCPQGHTSGSQACVKTTYTVKEPVTRTVTTATHGDSPLSFAQFQVLTDHDYEDNVAVLEDHSEACQEANVPRWIGTGLAIGGIVAYGIGASRSSGALATVGLIGLGGGAASYTAGYFAFGGKRCVQAARLYREINYARDKDVMSVNGSLRAEEMKSLSDQFNERAARSAAAQ